MCYMCECVTTDIKTNTEKPKQNKSIISKNVKYLFFLFILYLLF